MNIRFQSRAQILQNLTEASHALLTMQTLPKAARAKYEGMAIARVEAASEDPYISNFAARSERYANTPVVLDDGNSLADIWEFRSPAVSPTKRHAAFTAFDQLVTGKVTHPGIEKLIEALRTLLPS